MIREMKANEEGKILEITHISHFPAKQNGIILMKSRHQQFDILEWQIKTFTDPMIGN